MFTSLIDYEQKYLITLDFLSVVANDTTEIRFSCLYYLQAMSTSTLPHSYPSQPHHVPQQPLQQKFPSQPDLQHRPGEGRTNYENYPGQQRPQLDDPYNRDRLVS